jgi:hypothetical protein
MTTTYLTGPAANTNRTSGIAAASIATAKAYLGGEIDNATNLDDVADIEITWSFATNPTAAKSLDIYLIVAHDGTNYEEGAGDGSSTTTLPLESCKLASVSPTADTSTHRKSFRGIPLEPMKYKPLVYNNATGQTATVTLLIGTRKYQSVG